MNSDHMTLKSLLEKLPIRIPKIQRDYVQGQKDAEVDKIRGKLARDLLCSNDDKYLFFIYGKETDGFFIPLDGQQRLTTLFLLHWYLSLLNDREEDFLGIIWPSKLETVRFQHDANPEMNDFIAFLLRILSDEDVKQRIQNDNPSSILKDRFSEFKRWWLDNPGIVSMMRMLDAFHSLEDERQRTYDTLDRIHFSFLSLNDPDMKNADEDLIFIKMNSTGKQLSNWELFKSKIMREMTAAHVSDSHPRLFSRIDNEYMDYCLTKIVEKDSDSKKIEDVKIMDTVALNLMKTMMIVFLKDRTISDDSSLFAAMDGQWKIFADKLDGYITSLICAEDIGDTFSKERHQNLLEMVSNDLKNDAYDFIRGYGNRVIIASFISGLQNEQGVDDRPNWYFRVVYNLIRNSNPIDDSSVYNAVNTVSSIKDESSLDPSSGSGFIPNTTIIEERFKLSIMKDPSWERKIKEVEKHSYLDGSIAMVLAAMKTEIGEENICQQMLNDLKFRPDALSLKAFCDAKSLVEKLLSESELSGLFRLERYLLSQMSDITYCTKYDLHLRTRSARDTSFKRLFIQTSEQAGNARRAFNVACNSRDEDLNRFLFLTNASPTVVEAICLTPAKFDEYMTNVPRNSNVELYAYCLARTPAYFDFDSSFFEKSEFHYIRGYWNMYLPLRKQTLGAEHTEIFAEYIASRNDDIFECCHSWASSILPSVRIKDPSNAKRTIGIIHAWCRTWKDYYVGDIDNSLLEKLEPEADICWDALSEYGVADDSNVCLRLLRKEADPILMDLERIDDIVLKIMDLVSSLRK